MLKVTTSLLAAGFLFAAGITATQALPVAPADQGLPLVKVAEGCGPGMHRGAYGRCFPNGRPMMRACPRGMHPGPMGRCRPNF